MNLHVKSLLLVDSKCSENVCSEIKLITHIWKACRWSDQPDCPFNQTCNIMLIWFHLYPAGGGGRWLAAAWKPLGESASWVHVASSLLRTSRGDERWIQMGGHSGADIELLIRCNVNVTFLCKCCQFLVLNCTWNMSVWVFCLYFTFSILTELLSSCHYYLCRWFWRCPMTHPSLATWTTL